MEEDIKKAIREEFKVKCKLVKNNYIPKSKIKEIIYSSELDDLEIILKIKELLED